MKEIKTVVAQGEWVVLEARKVEEETKKTETGLIMPGKEAQGQRVNNTQANGKVTVDFFIHSIGKTAQEKATFKVGDMVIIDDYDAQIFGSSEKMFCVCHYSKVKAVITH